MKDGVPLDTRAIGDKVRRARFSRGKLWTQKKLAEAAGLSQGYISAIERGEEFPSLKALRRISEVLDCPLKDFIDESTTNELLLQGEEASQLHIPSGAADGVLREALFAMVQAAIERPATINRLVDEVVAVISAQLEALESRIAALEGHEGRPLDGHATELGPVLPVN